MEHRGHRNRLKARFLSEGLDAFAEHEALELLLFYGKPQGDVNPLAHALIRHFGSLGEVLEADPQALAEVPGVGEHTAVLLNLMPALFRYYCQNRYREKPVLAGVHEAIAACVPLFYGLNTEHLYMLCLNAQHRLLRTALVHEGTVDRVAIYPREVARIAMAAQAQAVLLTHNHPGGSLFPSEQDVQVTLDIVGVLRPLGIDVLDHIIVAEGKGASLCRSLGLNSLTPTQNAPGLAADAAGHPRARQAARAAREPGRMPGDAYEEAPDGDSDENLLYPPHSPALEGTRPQR